MEGCREGLDQQESAVQAQARTWEGRIGVARTLEEVTTAWRLVYEVYRRMGFIELNPFALHAAPQAVDSRACVLLGRVAEEAAATMSVMHDREEGLPLDKVYPQPLRRLRAQGRRLVEVGLFADRLEGGRQTFQLLFELIQHALTYIHLSGGTDIVIGVHPHHRAFYQRYLHFEVIGPVSTHPGVCDQPVVLLHLPMAELLAGEDLPRGLRFMRDAPLPAAAFAPRYRFDPEQVQASVLGMYLRHRAARELVGARAIAG